jgi:hypothetical protein
MVHLQESGSGRKHINRCRSNHVILIKDSKDTEFIFISNQRIREVIIQNCQDCKFVFLDSAVVVSRTCRVIDCAGVELVFEQVDIRRIECYNVTNSKVVEIKVEPVIDNVQVYWIGACSGNKVNLSSLEHIEQSNTISYYTVDESEVPDNTGEDFFMSHFNHVLDIFHLVFLHNGEFTPQGLYRFNLLRGFVPETDRNIPSKDAVLDNIKTLASTPFTLTEAELDLAYDNERLEYFDDEDVLREKVRMLAKAIQLSNHCVIYTGAGVSTSANIPGK